MLPDHKTSEVKNEVKTWTIEEVLKNDASSIILEMGRQ